MRKKRKLALPPAPSEYLAAIGQRGGEANSHKQHEHRKNRAVKAMLHKKFPQDPRWQLEPEHDSG